MIEPLKQTLRRSPLAGPAADLHGLLTSPSATLRLWRDALETRREAAFARALPPPNADAPLLLVLSMTNNSYGAKSEAMLAFAAARHGWRVKILTSKVYTNAKRIFRAYGFTEFIFYEEFSNLHDSEATKKEVFRRASEQLSFQSVLAWTYRSAWIGPQLLSSVSRRRFDGAPDPRDASVRAALLEQLSVAIGFVNAAEANLMQQRPTAILVNEPNYHVLGPFVDVAISLEIPVVHYTQPSREDAQVFKKLTPETRRIHPNSLTPATFAHLLSAPWGALQERELDQEFADRYGGTWKVQSRNQPGTRDMSREQIFSHVGLSSDKPLAVLFSHVLWDANLFYGEDLFENYGEWFIESVRAAAANSRASWLIKLHPANIWKRKLSGVTDEYGEVRLIRERIGVLPEHVKLLEPDTPISTLSLFRTIDVGITVRGSVGYELPCFGVPVVTAGTGRYSGFGFTIDHDSPETYLSTLARAESLPRLTWEETRRARIHAHALLRRRPWTYSSFRTEIGGDVRDPLYQNLRPSRALMNGAAEADDLDRFARWLSQADSVDYLDPAPPTEFAGE